jgi:DNA-binding transcriptional LysR family regulator
MAIPLHANDLILFEQIARAGSFTRAGEQTGLPKATLSRRLAELETSFGERLIVRTTRRLALTEFGARMLDHARRLADEADAATAMALNQQAAPSGVLRVSLPPEFHELSMVRILSEFSSRHPKVRLDLNLSAGRVDLVAGRYDLAIRAATRLPDDSSLVARHIITMPCGLYASPGYLAHRGAPRHPQDLPGHTGLILVTSTGEQQIWQLARGDERWAGCPEHCLRANSLGLQLALSAQGLGIVGLSERFAREQLRQGRLQRVLPGWSLPPITLWCVTAGRRLLPRRTLAFIEILTEVLVDDH